MRECKGNKRERERERAAWLSLLTWNCLNWFLWSSDMNDLSTSSTKRKVLVDWHIRVVVSDNNDIQRLGMLFPSFISIGSS